MMRVAIIFNRLGPYHHARLSSLSERCKLSCVEICGIDQTYQWEKIEGASGFKRATLFAHEGAKPQPRKELQQQVNSVLAAFQPQVIAIPGWSSREALIALLWCRRYGVPTIVMSESQAIDEDRSWWKETIKRLVVKQFSAGLVGGSPHIDYLQQLGMQRERIFAGYDAIDNHHFQAASDLARRDATDLRRNFDLPERYFLASNRFIVKKNLPFLLQAYARYRKNCRGTAWSLVLLGDGELKPEISRVREDLGLVDAVLMPGFKQYNELPIYYGLAGAFIHASTTEQWGLVVNEAMASSLPVLVSNRCGCASDLVQDGVNGFTFDPYDVEELAGLMLKLSSGECDLAAMGEASRAIIADWGTENFAANLMRAAEVATHAPMIKPTLLDTLILKGLGLR
jgi:1,2-diacylglycerol 3-alpha-glucosyltransferase